jgi:UDP-GlcNAc:undecaprenyl-phosphate/decaprenyl-phosphate GlcNAc-1-phosphate transferase
MTATLISVAITAFAAALAGTPLVRALAPAWGLVDRPDAHRKLHGRATPLGGGIAVLAATLAAAILGLLVSGMFFQVAPGDIRELSGLLAAALCITFVGLIDDIRGLRGRQKLVGQVVAVAFVVGSGLSIQHVALFEWHIDLGPLAIPFTFFWLLGAINALNLLDGADGLATTIGIIASGSLSAMALACGHPVEAIIAAALAFALAGFLVFNFPPASIFLGDAGSMLIGLVFGVLAIRSTLKGPATVALAAPAAIMAIPILDSVAAIIRRSLTGRSIYTTDRGHLHHLMLRRGVTARGLVVGVGLMCGVTAIGALISVYLNNEVFALITAAGVVGMLIACRVFGFAEFLLLSKRVLRFVGSLVPSMADGTGLVRQETVRLQGSRNWDELWNALTDFAERHQLSTVRLELNIAWLHESFHATWERPLTEEPRDIWETKLPLAAHGRTLGRLDIAGPLTQDSIYELLSLLAELLESLEPCIYRLTAELPADDQVRLAEIGLPGAIEDSEEAADLPSPMRLKASLRVAP